MVCNRHGVEWEKLRKAIEEPLQQYIIRQYDKVGDACDDLVNRILILRNRQLETPANFIDEICKWSLECLCMILLNKKLGFLDPHGLCSNSEPALLLEDLRGATEAIRKCEFGKSYIFLLPTSL